jgi:hypothetical protein
MMRTSSTICRVLNCSVKVSNRATYCN